MQDSVAQRSVQCSAASSGYVVGQSAVQSAVRVAAMACMAGSGRPEAVEEAICIRWPLRSPALGKPMHGGLHAPMQSLELPRCSLGAPGRQRILKRYILTDGEVAK